MINGLLWYLTAILSIAAICLGMSLLGQLFDIGDALKKAKSKHTRIEGIAELLCIPATLGLLLLCITTGYSYYVQLI